MAHELCSRCLLAPAKGDGLCGACLRYRRRTGQGRPARLIVRHAERVVARDVTATADALTVPVESPAEQLRARAEEAYRERAERRREGRR